MIKPASLSCDSLYRHKFYLLVFILSLLLWPFSDYKARRLTFGLINLRIYLLCLLFNIQAKPESAPLLIYINRDCDIVRRESFLSQKLLRYYEPQRFSAIDGYSSSSPFVKHHAYIGDSFCGKNRFPKGALAAFISHINAWKSFLQTHHDICYIVEDDATVVLPPLKTLLTDSFGHFDILFINRRMSAFSRFLGPAVNRSNISRILCPVHSLKNLRSFIPFDSPGGDGYIISRSGAKRLLSFLSHHKITFELDWFLFYYSLSSVTRQIYENNDSRLAFLASSTPENFQLSAFVLSPWAVDSFNNQFKSSIALNPSNNWSVREHLF